MVQGLEVSQQDLEHYSHSHSTKVKIFKKSETSITIDLNCVYQVTWLSLCRDFYYVWIIRISGKDEGSKL
jgi:hypothetical protein